jgi:hypothetical protein
VTKQNTTGKACQQYTKNDQDFDFVKNFHFLLPQHPTISITATNHLISVKKESTISLSEINMEVWYEEDRNIIRKHSHYLPDFDLHSVFIGL